MQVAYQLFDKNNNSEIVFALPKYIQTIAEEHECRDWERIPDYDRYYGLGYVPLEELIKNSWALQCDNCEKTITHETIDPVIVGNTIFCCGDCNRSYYERIEEKKQTHARVSRYLLDRYPRLTNLFVVSRKGNIEASFDFPKGKYSARWQMNIPDIISVNEKDDRMVAVKYFTKHIVCQYSNIGG